MISGLLFHSRVEYNMISSLLFHSRVEYDITSSFQQWIVLQIPKTEPIPLDIVEPKTPTIEQNMSINRLDAMNAKSPWETFSMRGSGMKVRSIQNIAKWLYFSVSFIVFNLQFIWTAEFSCSRIPQVFKYS